ncbi:Msb2p NDAI_0K02580 [Naumovozyma dairenensis CBS 421]|uniref:Msb2 n=1 Tax=Naumovozyma dairenensis (strain ATCC 10597 / BCRC 20456 / CBS 421 / NBRC 0211 / NRRL Y-12639) TaxID=1071378 RepID=G0WI38_NAUDC|nr:hypothetical protein NDAI_0K02580 [Naumovozyma dairenensis CBS 421]CCD27449.1 hypothetical protein NDAI_0K02580 [Naumovozyma dairenensis CBS 421]
MLFHYLPIHLYQLQQSKANDISIGTSILAATSIKSTIDLSNPSTTQLDLAVSMTSSTQIGISEIILSNVQAPTAITISPSLTNLVTTTTTAPDNAVVSSSDIGVLTSQDTKIIESATMTPTTTSTLTPEITEVSVSTPLQVSETSSVEDVQNTETTTEQIPQLSTFPAPSTYQPSVDPQTSAISSIVSSSTTSSTTPYITPTFTFTAGTDTVSQSLEASTQQISTDVVSTELPIISTNTPSMVSAPLSSTFLGVLTEAEPIPSPISVVSNSAVSTPSIVSDAPVRTTTPIVSHVPISTPPIVSIPISSTIAQPPVQPSVLDSITTTSRLPLQQISSQIPDQPTISTMPEAQIVSSTTSTTSIPQQISVTTPTSTKVLEDQQQQQPQTPATTSQIVSTPQVVSQVSSFTTSTQQQTTTPNMLQPPVVSEVSSQTTPQIPSFTTTTPATTTTTNQQVVPPSIASFKPVPEQSTNTFTQSINSNFVSQIQPIGSSQTTKEPTTLTSIKSIASETKTSQRLPTPDTINPPKEASSTEKSTGAQSQTQTQTQTSSVIPAVTTKPVISNIVSTTSEPSTPISAASPVKSSFISPSVTTTPTQTRASSDTNWWIPTVLITQSNQPSESASVPTSNTATKTLPQVIAVGTTIPEPEGYSLITIGFKKPLNYEFIVANPKSSAQIFSFLPDVLNAPFNNTFNNITVLQLVPLQNPSLNYLVTVAKVYFPTDMIDTLSSLIEDYTTPSLIYTINQGAKGSLANLISSDIPLTGLLTNSLSSSTDSTSNNSDSNNSNSSSKGSHSKNPDSDSSDSTKDDSGSMDSENIGSLEYSSKSNSKVAGSDSGSSLNKKKLTALIVCVVIGGLLYITFMILVVRYFINRRRAKQVAIKYPDDSSSSSSSGSFSEKSNKFNMENRQSITPSMKVNMWMNNNNDINVNTNGNNNYFDNVIAPAAVAASTTSTGKMNNKSPSKSGSIGKISKPIASQNSLGWNGI